ncbi:MAG: hypothetical protein AAGL49_11595, partial [Pseudomonadota bacterium]
LRPSPKSPPAAKTMSSNSPGGDLGLGLKVSDDVFAAGGDITVDGMAADHAIIAGGDISFADVDVRDVIVAGGSISMASGRVADDVVAAGGSLNLLRGFVIEGSAMLTGGDLDISAPVGGDLTASAGEVNLNAEVGGDTMITAGSAYLGPATVIRGDFTHRVRELEIDPAAVIEGEVIALDPRERSDSGDADFRTGIQTAAATAAAAAFASLLVLTTAVIVLFPGLMNRTEEMMRARPVGAIGLGFITTVSAPFVIGFLMISIIGLFVGLMLLAMVAAAAPLAIAALVYWIGMFARRRFTKDESEPGVGGRFGWGLVGAAAVVFLSLIPVLGGLVWIIGFMFGFGAVTTQAGKALASA